MELVNDQGSPACSLTARVVLHHVRRSEEHIQRRFHAGVYERGLGLVVCCCSACDLHRMSFTLKMQRNWPWAGAHRRRHWDGWVRNGGGRRHVHTHTRVSESGRKLDTVYRGAWLHWRVCKWNETKPIPTEPNRTKTDAGSSLRLSDWLENKYGQILLPNGCHLMTAGEGLAAQARCSWDRFKRPRRWQRTRWGGGNFGNDQVQQPAEKYC